MSTHCLVGIFVDRPFTITVVALCLWTGYKLFHYGQREGYLPPGPPTKPLVGNMLVWPKIGTHYQFTEWASQYGEIFSLKLAHKTHVVLSSYDTFQQVLEKQSALSSDRPTNYIKERIEGQNNHLSMARYSDRWRSLRRATQRILSPQACRSHLGVQQAESIQLMYDILRAPEDVREHLRRFSTSVINTVMFGTRFPRSTTPMYVGFWDLLEYAFRIGSPASSPPIDFLPILKYVPERWAKWKTGCREVRAMQLSVFRKMLKPVEERLEKGIGNGAFMEEVYTRAKEWNLDDEAVLPFGYVMLTAGAETTSTFLQVFVLCLAAHPKVQQKLQEEMHRVVGVHGLPKLDDFENLPFLQAVVNEVHRFRPVAPLSIPHAASEDIHYKQYVLPKGTVIWQNTWGLFHDPEVFPDPDTFRPERFVEKPELGKYVDYAFGSGRRACSGIHLANCSIRINTMNIIWSFDISKAIDERGNVVEPNLHFRRESIVQGPTEVRVTIKPRSVHHENILRQTFKDTAEAFRPFEYDLDEEEKRYAEESRLAA